jgi:hypothetical protein
MRILMLLFAVVLSAAEPKAPNLSWMAGDWRCEVWGGQGEETWTANVNGQLIGMFRHTKAGQPQFYEFLATEQQGGELVLKMRHFGPDLKAWEEKDKALTWRVVESAANYVLFQSADPNRPSRMEYRREGNRLTSVLIRQKDGKEVRDTFSFTLLR